MTGRDLLGSVPMSWWSRLRGEPKAVMGRLRRLVEWGYVVEVPVVAEDPLDRVYRLKHDPRDFGTGS